ncbi:MAG: response regulator [Gemmatimonadota bacterium]
MQTANGTVAVAELLDRYNRLVEHSPDGILIHDGERILMANVAAARLAGVVEWHQLVGMPIDSFLNPPYLKGVAQQLALNTPIGFPPPARDTFRRLDGSTVEVEVTAIPFVDHGRPSAHLVLRDITDRLTAQEQARQSEKRLVEGQKLEAIGTVAGGVAHEVNNMMVVVLGACEFLLTDKASPSDQRRDLQAIHKAAGRAAALTRQLLAFSQRAAHQAHAVNLDDLVRALEPTVQRLLGEGNRLSVTLGGPLEVVVDSGQVEQVIVNLVLNARDAMPGGGVIVMTTARLEAKAGFKAYSGTIVPAGDYGVVTVCDTGTGIEAATLARIFEPFFTTKPMGQGTGLGLAAVHGIMEQNGGYISIETRLGVGTTFSLYFPAKPANAFEEPAEIQPPLAPVAGILGATVLVVDDEPAVRTITARMLQTGGYRTRQASSGAEALEAVARNGPPDLVLSDLMMPGIDGAELARRLGLNWPRLPVILMSGYSAGSLQDDTILGPNISLIQKPFTRDELLGLVASILATHGVARAAS